MDYQRYGTSATRRLVWSGILASLIVAGCVYQPDLPGRDPDNAANYSTRSLVAGESVVRLDEGLDVHVFEVDVAADQDIEIIATPSNGAKLGIGFAISPDNYKFAAYPCANLKTSNGRFEVKPQNHGEAGTGFRFLGTADEAGTWRFSVLAQPKLGIGRAEEILAGISWRDNLVANIVLPFYLLFGQPDVTCGFAVWFYGTYSEITLLDAPIDITLNVRAAAAGEYIDPGQVTDDDGSNSGDNNDGSNDGNDGSSGDDSNDGDSGNNDNTDAPRTTFFQAIARTGDDVPDQDGATFTYFGNPIIDDDGRLAFFAAYKGGDGDAGLYVWTGDELVRVFDTDEDEWTGNVPGLGAEDYFGDITVRWNDGAPHLAWGTNGELLFATPITGYAQPNALFRWSASDGSLTLMSNAELMRTAIEDSSEDFLAEYYHLGLADDGTAFFSNRYSYFTEGGSFKLFQRGIFVTDGTDTELIGEGDVPEEADGATFYQKPSILTSCNASGNLLFQATYYLGDGDNGVFLWSEGDLYRVIDNAATHTFTGLASGTEVNADSSFYEAIALGEDGQIAIDTTLTVDGAKNDAVLLWDNSKWYELVGTDGEEATDLLTSVSDDGQTIYLADGRPHISNGVSTEDLTTTLPTQLQDVEIEWQPYGAAINNQGRALVRYLRPDDDNAPGLLFWSGERWYVILDGTSPFALDTIDAIFSNQQYEGADGADLVGTLSDRPENNRPGLSGIINDNDYWTVRAASLGDDGRSDTADDTQGIFLGHAE